MCGVCVFEHVGITFSNMYILTSRNGREIEDTLVLNVFHVCEYIRDMVYVNKVESGLL